MQSLVAAQISEYRFDRRESARDHLSPHIGINLYLHPVDVIFRLIPFALEESNLPDLRLVGSVQIFLASQARYAILLGSAEFPGNIAIDGAI